MLFNSIQFFVFFPIVTGIFFALPHRWRWVWLLIASAYFYMAFVPVYILILVFTILTDYLCGLRIAASEGAARKRWLIVSILANGSVLCFFKYFNFANENIAQLAHFLGWNYSPALLRILLPIGLSFHTFQSMSYTIEVYRGKFPAEKHLGYLALYVLFYPQLVAGPIERPQNLLPQFHTAQFFDYARAVEGLKLIFWGLCLKMTIADRLAPLVNRTYSDPLSHSGLELAIATVLFAFQIFCDFAGYSTIAIGSALVMGYRLMVNFRAPYLAASTAEFWQRWHISLSTWFRDYLYIPLGGNRVPQNRRYANLLLVFLISGLWHGANWTYVTWGALNGIYVVAHSALAPLRNTCARVVGLANRPALRNLIATLSTFGLICISWVFFRADSIGVAIEILKRCAHLSLHDRVENASKLVLPALLIVSLIAVQWIERRHSIGRWLAAQPAVTTLAGLLRRAADMDDPHQLRRRAAVYLLPILRTAPDSQTHLARPVAPRPVGYLLLPLCNPAAGAGRELFLCRRGRQRATFTTHAES